MSRDDQYRSQMPYAERQLGSANALMGRNLTVPFERPKSPYEFGTPEYILWSNLQDVRGEMELCASAARDYEARRVVAEAQYQAIKTALEILTGKGAG